jgi:hypothetical protein
MFLGVRHTWLEHVAGTMPVLPKLFHFLIVSRCETDGVNWVENTFFQKILFCSSLVYKFGRAEDQWAF